MSKHFPEGRGSKDSGSAEMQGTQLGAGTERRTAPGNGPRRWQCSLGFGGPCSVLSSVHLSLALPSEQPCEGTWLLSHVTGDKTQHGEGTQPAHGLTSTRRGAGMQTPGRTGSREGCWKVGTVCSPLSKRVGSSRSWSDGGQHSCIGERDA